MKKIEKIEGPNLYYNSLNLEELAVKYGTPLKVVFLDNIKERIQELQNSFAKAIKVNNYQGKFIYAVANKANYSAEALITSAIYSDAIEVSSYYDLCLTQRLFSIAKIDSNKAIICNGYKTDKYLEKIVEMQQNGFNILDIIDSVSEYEALSNLGVKINVGIRTNLKSLYSEEANDRFGLTRQEVDMLIPLLKSDKNVKLTTIHFHQRGIHYNNDKFYQNLQFVIEKYVLLLTQEIPTIENINLGGGTPLPVYNDFDYCAWTDGIIKFMQKYNLNLNIILENGRYTFKDSTVNLYKVIGEKETTKNIPWYIIDGSLLVAMSECYEIGEDLAVEPINLLKNDTIKAKLAGVTCDCDDVYFDHSRGCLDLPYIGENETLYIGLLGTGSYQESMSGRNGVHHCLLPEEKRLVVKDGNMCIVNELQSVDDIAKLIKCNEEHLKKFI